MTSKSLLWIGALALSSVAMAGPKTFDLVLSTSVKAGDAQLDPGDYKVKIEGSNAIFTDAQTRKSLSVPVTVENADKKYHVTTLDTSKQSGREQIVSIAVGGSKIKLEFAQ